jgi:hypothetical protein
VVNKAWLTERCATTDITELRLQDLAALDLVDASAAELLGKSEQHKRWEMKQWRPFIALMKPGDELWRFSSPATNWANLAGAAGYAIVRNGDVVSTLVTIRS